jgi:hypothetical protein
LNDQDEKQMFSGFLQFHERTVYRLGLPADRSADTKARKFILLFGALSSVSATMQRYVKWDDTGAQTWLVPPLAFSVLLALVYLFYLAAAHFQKLPATVRRRPQISLHLLFWALLAFLWLTPDGGGVLRNVLVLVAISLPFLLWRCGYMLRSGQRARPGARPSETTCFISGPCGEEPTRRSVKAPITCHSAKRKPRSATLSRYSGRSN